MDIHHKRRRFIIYGLILLAGLSVAAHGAMALDAPPSPQCPSAATGHTAPAPGKTDEPTRQNGDSEKSRQPDWEEYAKMADAFHRMVSKKLISSANWLDSFFRLERSEIEENNSNLRLRLSFFLEDGEGVKSDVRARLRLVLPELKNKLHIIVTGEQDEEKDLGTEPVSKTGEIDKEADRNFNLSLRYFLRMARDRNLSFKVGARLNSFSPVVYAGPRFRISKQVDDWLIRFTQEVQYVSDDGWETETDLDFERALTKRLFLRTTLEGNWYEHEIGYYYETSFVLYQMVDEDRALEYGWSNYFQTRPCNLLAQTFLWVKYRQRFWRKWLFFELQPQLAFREEDDYHPTPGITFAVEALFGNKYW